MAADTTETKLPQDRDSYPIQVLAPDDTTVAQASIAAGNNRIALPTGSQVVELGVQDTCRVAFGTSSVDVTVGTRRLLVSGVYVYRVPYTTAATRTLATDIAVTSVGGSSGVVTITRLV